MFTSPLENIIQEEDQFDVDQLLKSINSKSLIEKNKILSMKIEKVLKESIKEDFMNPSFKMNVEKKKYQLEENDEFEIEFNSDKDIKKNGEEKINKHWETQKIEVFKKIKSLEEINQKLNAQITNLMTRIELLQNSKFYNQTKQKDLNKKIELLQKHINQKLLLEQQNREHFEIKIYKQFQQNLLQINQIGAKLNKINQISSHDFTVLHSIESTKNSHKFILKNSSPIPFKAETDNNQQSAKNDIQNFNAVDSSKLIESELKGPKKRYQKYLYHQRQSYY